MTLSITTPDNLTDQDKLDIYALWQSTLGDLWPINQPAFEAIAFGAHAQNYLATDQQKGIGFLSAQTLNRTGSIVCILVDVGYQHQGIGTQLLNHAMKDMAQQAINKVDLGSGGLSYFWPGVPTNLESAAAFFTKNGWQFTHTSVDMTLPLAEYVYPNKLFENLATKGIQLKQLSENQASKLLAFEKTNFPEWLPYFSTAVETGRLKDILIAISTAGEIQGSALIEQNPAKWKKLGSKIGDIGCVGVAVEARNQGIGLALAAQGTKQIKDAGCETAFLGWTWLIDWYGKLGYKVWSAYQMGSKSIS